MRRMWSLTFFPLGITSGCAFNFKLINNIRLNINYQPFATQAGQTHTLFAALFSMTSSMASQEIPICPAQAQRPWLTLTPIVPSTVGLSGSLMLPTYAAPRWLMASPDLRWGINKIWGSLEDPRISPFIQQTLIKQLLCAAIFLSTEEIAENKTGSLTFKGG